MTAKSHFFLCILLISCLVFTSASASSFSRLVLPEKLTEIKSETFFRAKSLDVVVLPEGMTTIGSNAFAESSLKSINLPDSITSIAEDAFSGTSPCFIASPGSYAYDWCVEHNLSLLADSIHLPVSNLGIIKGASAQLPIAALNGGGRIGWFSSDRDVVSINDDMTEATAHAYGTVTLTAYVKENPAIRTSIPAKVLPDNPGLVVYEGTIEERFAALKEQFPHKKYWNNAENGGVFDPNAYTDEPCSESDHERFVHCGIFEDGTQCWGFANRIAYGLFGNSPGSEISFNWFYTEDKSMVDYLEPGDWVRYGNHSFVVWKVSGDKVTCVEANYGGRCMINWGTVRTKSQIKEKMKFIYKNPETKYLDKLDSITNLGNDIYYEYNIVNNKAWITYIDFAYQKECIIPDRIDGYPIVGFDDDLNFDHTSLLQSITYGQYWEDTSFTFPLDYYSFVQYAGVSENNEHFCSVDGVIYSKDMTTMYLYPDFKKDTSYTIPNSVKTIRNLNNKYLTHIYFSSNLSYYHSLPVTLKSIDVPEDNTSYSSEDNVLYNKQKTEVLYVTERPFFVIPETVNRAHLDEDTNYFADALVISSYVRDLNIWLYSPVIIDGVNLVFDNYNNSFVAEDLILLNCNAPTFKRYYYLSVYSKVYGDQNSNAADFAAQEDAEFYKLSLSLNNYSSSLSVGNATYLSASMPGLIQTQKIITWTSSNPSVASVDDSGKVIAKSKGKATITASVFDGKYTAQCSVTVN